MKRPIRIFYVGTYEDDYPRNVLTIAALRRAGYDVRELNRPVWNEVRDKTALIDSPTGMFRLGLRLVLAYTRLTAGLVRHRRQADLFAFGYIGQLDVLLLGPLVRALRKPILFDPLVMLTDTLIEDREKVRRSGFLARAIRLTDRLTLRMATVILSDTMENRDSLTSTFGIPFERVHVVPVGADERVFTARTRNAASASGASLDGHLVAPGGDATVEPELRVLFYGNMIPLQGVETIVQAAKLLEANRDVSFEIIGTGQTYPAVRTLADRLGVRNVSFISRVPYDELPRRIERADVVLGIFGGSSKAGRVVPNKVYQAMAMGAAIVTRDSPAARNLLRDGESALLVSPGDPEALAAAILKLRDTGLRQRLSREARRRFEQAASLEVQAEAVRFAVETAFPAVDATQDAVTA